MKTDYGVGGIQYIDFYQNRTNLKLFDSCHIWQLKIFFFHFSPRPSSIFIKIGQLWNFFDNCQIWQLNIFFFIFAHGRPIYQFLSKSDNFEIFLTAQIFFFHFSPWPSYISIFMKIGWLWNFDMSLNCHFFKMAAHIFFFICIYPQYTYTGC